MKRKRSEAEIADRIRRLELETGVREWDAEDDKDAESRMYAQVRYTSPDALARFIVEEKQRLGIA